MRVESRSVRFVFVPLLAEAGDGHEHHVVATLLPNPSAGFIAIQPRHPDVEHVRDAGEQRPCDPDVERARDRVDRDLDGDGDLARAERDLGRRKRARRAGSIWRTDASANGCAAAASSPRRVSSPTSRRPKIGVCPQSGTDPN